MTEELDAETFDLTAWLEDAHLPKRSVRVFKRADLLADIDSVKDQIEDERNAADGSLTGSIELAKLTEKYEELLEEFGSSALTVYVQAVPSPVVRKLRKGIDAEHDKRAKRSKEDAAEWRQSELVYSIMSKAIVEVAGPSGEKKPVEWSSTEVRALETALGTGQFNAIQEAKGKAEEKVEEPDPDFLLSASGSSNQSNEG